MIDKHEDKILENAKNYSSAAKYLNKIGKNEMNLLLPSQVNASLSLELYFKAFYYLINKKEFKIKDKLSHDFYKLYLELPQEIINQMNKNFNDIISKRNMLDTEEMELKANIKISKKLADNIKNWSGVFVKMRYAYEEKKESIIMMFFPEIEEVILKSINEFKSKKICDLNINNIE